MPEQQTRVSDFAWLQRDPLARQSSIRPAALAAHELATDRRFTYAALEDLVRRCEGLLRGLVSSGARVAFLGRNSVRPVVLFYGCPRAGAIFQPLNWRLSGAELAVLLEDGEPELLIYEAEFEREAKAALAARPVKHVMRIGETDAFETALAAATPLAPSPLAPEAPSMLLYTSGTTGRPKGVIVTPKSAHFAANNFLFVGEFTAGHAHLCDAPFFHVVGLLAAIHASILGGGAMRIADRFTPALTLKRLADPALAISHYFCVPQMVQTLVDEPDFEATDLTHLRLFTGGAPMPAELTLRLCDAGIRPCNGYGMSENGTVMGVPLDIETARRKVGSAGVPAPSTEVRIFGADGVEMPDGEVGEIWMRGPAITPGYWRQPEATANTFSGDWFKSGDAGYRNADGFFFIVDRWKDMYITGGENVYPAEVEAVLGAMDCIAEVAVVGVPDARWGESGAAFITLRPEAQCDDAKVAAWCADRLARYKRPAHIRFVDALPRTASGKVQKDVLRRAFTDSQKETVP